MAHRISGLRDQAVLPVSATPAGEVSAEDVTWVEGPYPVFHELEYTWTVDGEELPEVTGSRSLELPELGLGPSSP